jgi:hypothetical protein
MRLNVEVKVLFWFMGTIEEVLPLVLSQPDHEVNVGPRSRRHPGQEYILTRGEFPKCCPLK